jgi:hypothetical protein
MVASLKPGPNTILALEVLAASSALLEPPTDELPDKAPPSVADQQSMIRMAQNYVTLTLHHLPNLLATRVTRSFDDTPPVVSGSGWAPTNTQLHSAGTFAQEITYRDGREAFTHSPERGGEQTQSQSPPGLTSWGEFGPLLAIILIDSSHGHVSWSHWEQTAAGLAAVFHYEVPKAASHYVVDFCCVRNSAVPSSIVASLSDRNDPSNAYHGTPGYHGSLYLDPISGTILRITLDTDLKGSDPITRSATSVQYVSVEIGGKNYVCPARSIVISSTHSHFDGELIDRTILRINEVSFTNYRRFGSAARVITVSPAQ